MAVTLTVRLPRVVTSAVVSTTACDAPVPVRVLVTVLTVLPAVLVKVTVTVEAASAVTRTTPVDWVASARVAPLLAETPVPKARVGLFGLKVSTVAV